MLSLLIFSVLGICFGLDKVPFPQMLEISTRPWLYSLSQKYNRPIQRLADIPLQEFKDIAAQGYNVVWMMGVWQLGAYGLNFDRTDPGLLQHYSQVLPGFTQDDIIGSPYAVVNYTCNPSIGSDSDLQALRKLLNSLGLFLMLDFVPNHSAVDAGWIGNPNYYVREPTNVPHDPNRFLPNGYAFGWGGWGDSWKDTAQFNYWDSSFRQIITQNVIKIASVADYIRCDMAHLLINNIIQSNWGTQLSFYGYKYPQTEAWSDIITSVKKRFPAVKFLAEVYNPNQQTLQSLGFDFTYDKTLYDKLGGGNLDDIRNYISSQPLNFHQRSAHFVENHDEPRAASFFGGNMRADGAAAVTMTLPGMRFYFEGQQYGYFNPLDVHLRRGKPEGVNPGVLSYYKKLVSIISDDVFTSPQSIWEYKNVGGSSDSWRLMAWQWKLKSKKVLCVINYSDTQGSGRILLPDAQPVNGNDNISVTELISGQVYQRSANELRTQGLFAIVQYWSIQIFEFN